MFASSSFRARGTAFAIAAAGTLSVGALLSVVGSAPANAAPAETRMVSTAAELNAALESATAGQTIELRDGTYEGKFELTASGTSDAPITLRGSRDAILTTGSNSSGYALHGTGDFLVLTGFSVSSAQKGIVLDSSSDSVISGVDVGTIGMEGIHVRTDSKNVTVRDSVVHDTGLVKPGAGEGIYIGTANTNWGEIMGSSSTADQSDNATVQNNTLRNTAAEGIDAKEGTTGGKLLDNVFDNAGYSGANNADSWVDVKGNDYVVSGNTGGGARLDAFQVHDVYSGWGRNNTFTNNDITGDVPGHEVQIAGSTSLENTVTCKNSNADEGLTNLSCE